MLAYAISAALLVQAPPQPLSPPSSPPPERIGAWEIRVSVDPVTDEVDIGAYLGTNAEQFVIACGKGYPESTVVVWRSSRMFRETAVGRVPVANITYRFDQDAPVATLARLRDNNRVDFDVADLPRICPAFPHHPRINLQHLLHPATSDQPSDPSPLSRRSRCGVGRGLCLRFRGADQVTPAGG